MPKPAANVKASTPNSNTQIFLDTDQFLNCIPLPLRFVVVAAGRSPDGGWWNAPDTCRRSIWKKPFCRPRIPDSYCAKANRVKNTVAFCLRFCPGSLYPHLHTP
jgi:hypothetical protein